MRFSKALILAAVTTWLGPAWTATAQTVEEFYARTPLTIVVSAAAGGGSDNWVRQFAPFLQKHLEGNPRIVVTNNPGASGMTAAIRLQTNTPADGSVIALLQRNNLYFPLVSDVEMEFDPSKVSWVGSLNRESYGVLVGPNAGIKSHEDLFKKPLKISATSFANENRVIPAMMNQYYGTRFEIVQGYDGSPAMSLALERGEVDGRLVSLDFLMAFAPEKPWLADGRAAMVLTTAMQRSEDFPEVPNILELTEDPDLKALSEFMMLPMEAGLPFAAPPDIPEDRLAALRKAFMAAATDPEYLAAAKAQGSQPKPISGEDVARIVDRLYATDAATLAKVRALINPPK